MLPLQPMQMLLSSGQAQLFDYCLSLCLSRFRVCFHKYACLSRLACNHSRILADMNSLDREYLKAGSMRFAVKALW